MLKFQLYQSKTCRHMQIPKQATCKVVPDPTRHEDKNESHILGGIVTPRTRWHVHNNDPHFVT